MHKIFRLRSAAVVFTWLWTIMILLPLLFLLSLSFAEGTSRNDFIFWIFPAQPSFENYIEAFVLMDSLGQPLFRTFLNSFMVTGATVVGSLVLSCLAAYAIAFHEFPGRKLIFIVLCVGLVVPTSVMIVPEFLTVRSYGLTGLGGLILPYIAFGLSLPVLLLSTFFRALPSSIIEAARIDGANSWRLLVQIVMPLSRPVLATVALLLFVTFWNEFPLAVNLINDPAQSTIPVALSRTTSRQGLPYPIVAAVMVLAAVPLLAIMAIGQRQLVEGLVQGGEKG